MSFEENVRKALDKYGMLRDAPAVYCGLSGGADSVSMLLVLDMLKEEYGFELRAVHVNHHIRGAESDRDQRFCEELCRRLNIPIEIHDVDAPAYCALHKLSPEEGARELRYEIFGKIPQKCKAATAHTLNDSAETVLFNLARGTGIKGLTGIPPVRGNIIRPLILCTRDEVEGFLRCKGQSFVTDSTNLSEDYTRNKIRHNIIPLMKELHGGFAENIRRMTETLACDAEFLENEAEKHSSSDLRELHPAIRKRVIINALKNAGAEVSYARISDIESLLPRGGKLNVSGDIFAVVKNGKLSVRKQERKTEVFEDAPAHVGENPFLCDKTVIITVNKCEMSDIKEIINNSFTNECLDYDKIQGGIVLRSRKNGDRFTRVNRSFESSLKKLMNENVPADERASVPVLADEAGVIWVQGFGIADRVKVGSGSRNIMYIKVRENGQDQEDRHN